MFVDDNTLDPRREQSITFSPNDYEGIIPHDDDPIILYYDAFEKLGLDPKQLQPLKGTTTTFTG